ncbi:MAG: S9 family peptidase [Acidobacteria bacterium]|nr:S9 family peptidase [Acidobacteriota bacterium]
MNLLRTIVRHAVVAVTAMSLPFASSFLAADRVYQKPPKEVLDILHAPAPPQVSLSPTLDRILLYNTERYPSIADLAEPMLRLAGERINPNTNGPHRSTRLVGMQLIRILDGSITPVTIPPGAKFSVPSWSADGRHLALMNTTPSGMELRVMDTQTGRFRKIPGIRLNAAFGDPLHWLPDQKSLLVQVVPAGRGAPPAEPKVPLGPKIQENLTGRAPVWTFQDLLRNAHDEDLYDYYATSRLAIVDIGTGKWAPLGKPGIVQSVRPSPDGRLLLVSLIHRPYSYLVTAEHFPREIEIWDRSGNLVHKVASIPLQEQVQADGVPVGPRAVRWRPDEPSTLVWVEALDGGDPKAKVAHRDRILQLRAPFRGPAAEIVRTEFRFTELGFFESGGTALLSEFDRPTRRSRTWLINMDAEKPAPRKIWDRNAQDRYRDPGSPLMRTLANGQRVIRRASGNAMFLAGAGASPQGDRPFLDEFDLSTLAAKRIYRCKEGAYERILDLLAEDGSTFLTRYESPQEPPNIFVRNRGGAERRALTQFKDPTPQLRRIRKQLVTYKRDDGVQLSFTLYLPPGYKEGERLPTVVWAYPREYTGTDVAGQISGSPHRFTTIEGTSHLFFLTQDYAILDDVAIPVVGDSETVNNTYVEQIVSSARAAIDKAVEMGVTDRERVGVGGHSYGAFMTANLLSHCNLFRAGIARSGAYNRTLTPFGFQSERRTLWEAPETYVRMSPFMFAHKIDAPILLIHGEADNNSGTFPIQSERYYHALKGQGKTVRYVVLPLESHGYAARESVEHTLWEMIGWFDRHLKKAALSK